MSSNYVDIGQVLKVQLSNEFQSTVTDKAKETKN